MWCDVYVFVELPQERADLMLVNRILQIERDIELSRVHKNQVTGDLVGPPFSNNSYLLPTANRMNLERMICSR